MALSEDFRKLVVEAAVRDGMSRAAAAKRFGVGIASAVRRVRRSAGTGEISPDIRTSRGQDTHCIIYSPTNTLNWTSSLSD